MPETVVGSGSTDKSKRTLSIRVRLMLLALVAVVPLLAERVQDIQADRAAHIEATYRQALNYARLGADRQNEVLVASRAFLQVAARVYPTFAQPAETCNNFVRDLAGRAPWARAISIANSEGRIICGSAPVSLGLDISDRPHFREAVHNGGFVVSDYSVGRRLGAATVFAAYADPPANGKADAVFIAMLDLNWMARLANLVAQQSASVVLLIDRGGTVLARQPGDEWVGKNVRDHAVARALLASGEGSFTAADLDGVRRLFGFVQVPGANAHLAVGIDESGVLGPANRAAWLALGQIAAITLLVLAGIWSGGERLIVRPIRAFVATTAQVSRGERDPRTEQVQWSAEFAPLATAIDDMAAKLALRERELNQMNGHLLKLAQVDSLTELANRRTFDTRLLADWYAAEYLKRPLALLMVDIDFFKAFNDLYGHAQGDDCLRAVCRVLSRISRSETDLAARYGGEEFVLLLPGATVEAAVQVANRLCKAIDQLGLVNDGSSFGHVTVSIGVASMQPTEGAPAQGLVEAADAALYQAKQSGRNQVVAHGLDPVTGTRAVA